MADVPVCAESPARARITLRSAIIGFFLCFGLVLTIPLAWYNYSGNSQAALEVAGTLFDQAASSVSLRVRLLMHPFTFLGDHAPLLPRAAEAPEGFEHPLKPFLLDFLEDNPQLYSLYLAHGHGEFFQLISLGGQPKVASDLGAPDGTRFALRDISAAGGQRMERWRFLDRNQTVLATTAPRPAAYDPRVRPWFETALKADGPVRTGLYVFGSTRGLGLTLSRRLPGPGAMVFGADMTVDSLSRFLGEQKIGPSGVLFLFQAQGGIIAQSGLSSGDGVPAGDGVPESGKEPRQANLESLDDPLARAVYARFVEAGRTELPRGVMNVGGRDYLVQVRRMGELGSDQDFIALASLASGFTGPLARIRDNGLILAAGLLLAALAVLVAAARRFSGHLRLLAQEADRIRTLDLDSPGPPPSRIEEMEQLNGAVASMRCALKAFSRYLPQTLVRQFIASGLTPEPGGERREITLLFTDVENFTPLSEHLAPEDLMQAMTEYFEVIGQAVLDSGGTIDKFIGDAVMAFWNAPFASENHVENACLAALRLSRASEELNRRRQDSGLPLLRTRVGIHTGPAVVGNLGSSERMDYTALGASVNLASRLEGLNKFYATQILVSRTVRERARHTFLFRSVDVVAPKGASDPVLLFELVGAMPQSPYADVAAPRARLGFCSRWERAITLYRTARWDKAHAEFTALLEAAPGDHLAQMYQTRARRLMENKQGRDWKAVKRYMTK